MGPCVSINKPPPSPIKTESPTVTKLEDLNVKKADFIVNNKAKFKDQYSIGKLIGKGGLGEVRKCKQKSTGNMRAVKII